MTFTQKLQKLFHTDKWWGKMFLSLVIYIIYILIGYILIPFFIILIQNFNFGGLIFFLLLFIIIPIFSYYIPKFISKIFKVNKILLYFFHTIIIIIPFIFIFLILSNSTLNFGGF